MLVVAALLFVLVEDFLARRLVRCCSPFVEDDLRVVDLAVVLVEVDLPLLVDRFLRFEPKSSTIIAAVLSLVVELSFCCCFLPRFIFLI